ncbi:MAG: anti-sigma factor, partial [Actinomycetota bacterium]|nr:anti-sigma factor [Actinomycetota bacterium]
PAAPAPGRRQPASWRARAAGMALAAAAAVIAVMGVQLVDQDRRLDQMSARLELDALDRAYQAAVAMPGSEVVQITSFDGSLATEAVITEDGSAYLQASTLPPLPEGRTYQLWGDVGDRAVSLGVLGADPNVVRFGVSEQFRGLALTEEEEPGVVVTEQPILAYGQLHGD